MWLLVIPACTNQTPSPPTRANDLAVVEDAQDGDSKHVAIVDEGGVSDVSTGRAALIKLGATLVEDSRGDVTEVNLAHRQVTDATLVHLVEMPKLKKLHLEGTQVTSAGVRHLFELRGLRLINLGNTLVSVDGRRKLREKLPEAIVFPLDLSGPSTITLEGGQETKRPRPLLEKQEIVRRMPGVYLSEGHKALCRVKVGDQMPELTLEASDGDKTSLADHYGETLTVVFFWTANRYQARDQLLDMDPDIVRPFSNRGVRVVGIVVGDPTPETKRLLSDSRVTFPNLLDHDQSAFAKVGSEKMPRTYLLDRKGKILWFDIEYSLGTRRALREAIQFVLGEC